MYVNQKKLCACLALWHSIAAADRLFPRQTPAPSSTGSAAPEVTAVTGCHLHGSQLACIAGGTEFVVKTTPTQTSNIPAQFTGCHHHGSDMFCIGPDGEDVEVSPEAGNAAETQDHGSEGDASAGHKHCHFHAGVEHCVGGDENEAASGSQCQGAKRDYNVGLRVGLLFAILATSALGVFAPILLQSILPRKLTLAFIVLKQFGTGIIVSTAFVHLYTHATLMFGNKCLGQLGYEGTTSAILMAGLFLSFLIEYIGQRIVQAKTKSSSALTAEEKAHALLSAEVVSILVMEAGILFHSLLIGLTLVVAGDSFFVTLFVVILFHQVFEGLALGTRIATLGTDHHRDDSSGTTSNSNVRDADKSAAAAVVADPSSSSASSYPLASSTGFSMKKKLGLAALFAFITPIGMAIGIGVLQKFNGNDRSTLIAIGTLDALSAGILVWVGVVEMWAADWMVGAHGHRAELADANMLTVTLAGFGLVAGMALMSLLGKWA
ncbi:ZIP zinc transporter [Hirsutella rhossiliensis]|uniref:ZIP zinc transporter domain-containing protein n=1 Tax=Hirsutella rhossiliensis TaxID=111463 RepID=A0A9P8MPX6_9HYPO|nr:ZIP zinc transporter domain-containing protein [Hirsutella rhossiliensis]KAH0958031.1 ZIP zinc transporter domain-containing protein [Hirsutella rhossiliensis]